MFPGRWLLTGLLSVIAMAASVREARAQLSAGVIAGANSASLTFPSAFFPAEDVDVDFSRRTGFAGGVFVNFPAGRVASIEIGALFSQKGAAVQVTVPGLGFAEGDYRIGYLEIPVLGRAGIAQFSKARIFLLAGPSIGIKLGARTKITVDGVSQTMDFSDEIPATDVGLAIGGRLEVNQALVELRYTHGFTNLAPDAEGSVKNRVVSVLIGWRFGGPR
jgi:hypothetical protein